jgi:type IV pilus assembly protein PilO
MAPTAKNKKEAAQPSIADQITPGVMVGLGVGAVAIVCALYYFLGYQPVQESIGNARRQTTELDTQQRNANRDLRAYNDDVAELERSRNTARDQQRVLPNNPDIPGFLRSIHLTAQDNQLQMQLVQPEPESVDQYYVKVPVRVEVKGSFLELARFFRAIAALPRVINMENIVLNEPTKVDDRVVLSARMLATTFRALNSDEQQRAVDALAARADGDPGRSTDPSRRGAAGGR